MDRMIGRLSTTVDLTEFAMSIVRGIGNGLTEQLRNHVLGARACN